MLYPRVLAITLIAALSGCGDDHKMMATPDGGMPDGGGSGSGATCSLDVDPGVIDGGTWDTRFTVSGFTGPDGHSPTVYDFARDVDGSIVAAGEFHYLGGDRVEPLLRYKNGTWGPARTTWELEPPGSGFSAIAIDADGKLALATYDDFGERSGEIWLDDGTGLRVIGEFDGLVRTLAWYDDELWVAGWNQITTAATPIQGLAVWDGATWNGPPGGPLDGFAFELVKDGDDLLVGGSFAQIGGIAAANVATFDGTSWRALDFPNVAVYALARDASNELYAGGTFGDQFGPTGGFAHWNGTAWELAGGGLANRSLDGVVTDLALHDGSLYVSGCFLTAGGGDDTPGAVVSRSVARFDGTWHSLDDDTQGVLAPWIEPLACGDEGPASVWDVSRQRLFSDGDRILLGGSFPGVAGVMSQSVIAHDSTGWVPQGPAGLGLGGSIDRIGASSSCDVWGLGQISHVAGTPTQARVVHFTGDGWETVTDSIPHDAYCPGFAVSPAGEVAVGCMIFPPKGDAVGRIYRVSGTQLVQVGGDVPLVQTIAYDPEGHLWVGGGGATGYLGRLDGDTLTIVEDGFDQPVTQLDPVSSTDVIAAGSFTKVGALDASRIARWDGTTWHALGDGAPGMVMAVAHDATKVYISTYDEGNGMYLLGAFDGTTWTELATPDAGITPVSYFNFNALHVLSNGWILAGGTAWLDTDTSARGAFVFKDGHFTPLGGGVHGVGISGIAATSDAIWVAGSIAEAGAPGSEVSTIGLARYELPYTISN
jgi:hypothetical protein